MPHRFPPLAPQPPARSTARAAAPLPLADLALFTLMTLLLLA